MTTRTAFWNEEVETLGPGERRRLESERLIQQIAYNYRTSPFLAAKLDAAGVNPDQIRTIEDLALIPTMEKREIALDQPENQPHRGDLAKMLVHRRARRRGIGAALLAAAESSALAAGKTLLLLDTASGDAERLYARQGWQPCGQVPDYALWPDGRPSATTFFYKFLRA